MKPERPQRLRARHLKICQNAKKTKSVAITASPWLWYVDKDFPTNVFHTQTVSWQFSIAMRSILTYPRLCPVLRGLFYITHRKAAPKEGAPASEDEAVFRFKAVYLLHLVIFNVFTCMVLWCFVSWSVCESSCFTRFCSFQSCEVKDVVIPEETLIFLKARVPHVRTITCLWLSKEFESIHSRDVEWGISYWELETPLRH